MISDYERNRGNLYATVQKADDRASSAIEI